MKGNDRSRKKNSSALADDINSINKDFLLFNQLVGLAWDILFNGTQGYLINLWLTKIHSIGNEL